MENERLKKVFFLGVSNEERNNIAYSNFIYSLCYYCLSKMDNQFDVRVFNRHDMLNKNNIKNSVFEHIATFDMFIFLLDEMPLSYIDKEDNKIEIAMYNPNVWFELGIAATQLNKPIVTISRDVINPFYANDISNCQVTKNLEECYFTSNISMFENSQITDDVKDEWLKYWETEFAKKEKTDAHKELLYFMKVLEVKLCENKNPFANDVTMADFSNLLSTIGNGSVYELLKRYVASTVATFYSGEQNAFTELTDAVRNARSTLKTTRFANRSIVSGLERNASFHDAFMNQLYLQSRSMKVDSERIICNNRYTKWKDIYEMLLNGGDVKIYIRKSEYSTNFELVIVDDETTFIHFYQLSTKGKKNDDGTENVQDHQVINSTLKLEGPDVAEHMSEIFERLYQREPGDPSRTLLGIPTEVELEKLSIEDRKKENWLGNGVLQLKSDDSAIGIKRDMEVKDLLIESFIKWYPYMKNAHDKHNMGIGVGLLLYDSCLLVKLISFIKKGPDFDDFLKKTREESDKINEQLFKNPAYQVLAYQFSRLLEELEKDDGTC